MVSIWLTNDQMDDVTINQLKEHIQMTIKAMNTEWSDHQYDEKLLEALWVVYDYFAGEDEGEALKNQLNA